jgi:UDP-glucose 4-epimerase
MAILITGGAGYIGSHMVHALIDRQEKVVVLDNLSTGRRWLLPSGATFVEGSTGDALLVQQIIQTHHIREIIHFAASIVVPESVAQPLRYYENNTANSRTLLEAAIRGGVERFVFSSTAAVYGEPRRVPVDEDAPLTPTSPYGASKWMTEIMLRDVAVAHGLRYAALRYFNVAGADPQLRTGQSGPQVTHLIKIAAQAATGQRGGVDVYGTDYATRDGTCERDYVHVSDLAAAHGLALDYLRDGGESVTLNCGYGHGYTVREVIDATKRVSGVDFPVREAPRRPGDPARLVAATERIRAILGWQPAYDNLEQIIAHALAWERILTKRECTALLT